MVEPEQVVAAVEKLLVPPREFAGRRVLVTAGPTREMIDPVRFLSNRSSGKMGFAIAEAARDRGAEVTLISGPVTLRPPEGVEYVSITTAAELCEQVLTRAEACDIVIQAAAPADFRPKSVSAEKIKKTGAGMTLELENTTDIAAALGARKREGQILVAFGRRNQRFKAQRPPENGEEKRGFWSSPTTLPAPALGFRRHQCRDHHFPGRRAEIP